MAHEIEFRADRSQWSFAFTGERSAIWHRHGQEANPGWTLEDWKRESGTDFRVRKIPLQGIPGAEGAPIAVDTHQLLVREDNNRALSVVPREWEPSQNEKAFEFAAPLIEAKFADLSTAGVLFDGGICFVVLKTKDGFTLPGGDETEGFLAIQISHQYGNADLFIPTGIRWVCNNTRRFSLSLKSQAQIEQGKFVHRGKTNQGFDIEKANALVVAYRAGLNNYAEQAKLLTTKRTTPQQVHEYITRVFQLEELKEGTIDQKARRREHNAKVISNLRNSIETQPGANLSPGTLWAAYNGVSYWEDHGRWEGKEEPIYGKLAGAANDRKQLAFKTALELVD